MWRTPKSLLFLHGELLSTTVPAVLLLLLTPGQTPASARNHLSCLAGSGTEPEIWASASIQEAAFVLRLLRLLCNGSIAAARNYLHLRIRVFADKFKLTTAPRQLRSRSLLWNAPKREGKRMKKTTEAQTSQIWRKSELQLRLYLVSSPAASLPITKDPSPCGSTVKPSWAPPKSRPHCSPCHRLPPLGWACPGSTNPVRKHPLATETRPETPGWGLWCTGTVRAGGFPGWVQTIRSPVLQQED